MSLFLQFSTENSFGSAVIRYGTHSDFSHVDVVMPDEQLLGARMDTATPGVQIRPHDYAPFSRRMVIMIPGAIEDPIFAFLKAQIGKPYDKKAILSFFLGQEDAAETADRDWRAQHSWFCSELVAAAFEDAKLLKIVTPATRITPNDMFILAATISSSIYDPDQAKP